jgi:multiple sugar transport system permease protein
VEVSVATKELDYKGAQKARLARTLSPYIMISPSLLLMAALILLPLLRGIYMSFTEVNIMGHGEMRFIGLANYAELINDPIFRVTLLNTVVWTLSVVFFQYFIGLFIALLLNEPIPLRGLFRGLVLVPWVVPTVVAALVWRWIYVPDFGILNHILRSLGVIDQPLTWLSDANLAMPAVIAVGVWKWVPFMAIVLLSGLQSIPQELYDSAEVDGASTLQRFWHITMPHLYYLSGIVTMLSVIWTFNHFDIVYVMTRGGPANATHLLSTYAYLSAFTFIDFGYASVLSVFMLVVLLLFAMIYYQLLKRGSQSELYK